MTPRDRAKLDRLEHEIAALKQNARLIPARFAASAAAEPHRVIYILGGNAADLGGIEGIAYTSTFTATAAYDPDVDTVYQEGLGYGILFEDGIEIGNVLVRHNYLGYFPPLIAGDLVRAVGTTTITYDPGGGDPIVSMTAYIFDWV